MKKILIIDDSPQTILSSFPEQQANKISKIRFQQEVETIGVLKGKYPQLVIAEVYAFRIEEDFCYFTMTYIEGDSLDKMQTVLKKMLEVSTDKRYHSILEIKQDLDSSLLQNFIIACYSPLHL